jgi:alcohol dehydrogenase
MRAAVIEHPGIEHLHIVDRPDPTPGPGEVLVRIRAASLNYRDNLVVAGGYGARQKQEKLIPLSDSAGEIAALGRGVTRWKVGERVMGCLFPDWTGGPISEDKIKRQLGGSVDGCACEYRVFPDYGLEGTPDHLSDIEAATLPCAALTAWSAVESQGHVGRGDTVLTQGAGGVSLFALQFAHLAGASVIATSSSSDRLARLGTLGARHLINYREDPEWGRTARAETAGRGVDHVVEVGGGGTLKQSIRAVRVGGTISMIGVLSKTAPDFNPALVVMQNIRLQGVTVGSRDQFEHMLAAIKTHRLRPIVDRVFPLSELRAALDFLGTGRQFGKICIEI